MEEINNDIKPLVETENSIRSAPLIELKKTWKDYLFEFTLPFLAVTAAFFLNTQREEYVERNLERQYIQSIINDFHDDAELIDDQIAFHKLRIAQMDSLVEILSLPEAIKDYDKLYYLGRLATRSVTFANNEGTFEQMKNSATFRLIRNQEAANLIIDYYQKIKTISLVEEREKSDQEEYKRIAVQVFDPFSSSTLFDETKVKHIQKNPLSISNDTQLIRQLAGYIQYLNTSRSRLIFLKQDLQKTGIELVKKLKLDYKL